MGLSMLLVRYPSGLVAHGRYQNTADVPLPRLYAVEPEDGAAFDRQPPDPDAPSVPVTLYAHYGGGFYWSGRASGLWLTDPGLNEEGYIVAPENGVPEWARPYVENPTGSTPPPGQKAAENGET